MNFLTAIPNTFRKCLNFEHIPFSDEVSFLLPKSWVLDDSDTHNSSQQETQWIERISVGANSYLLHAPSFYYVSSCLSLQQTMLKIDFNHRKYVTKFARKKIVLLPNILYKDCQTDLIFCNDCAFFKQFYKQGYLKKN